MLRSAKTDFKNGGGAGGGGGARGGGGRREDREGGRGGKRGGIGGGRIIKKKKRAACVKRELLRQGSPGRSVDRAGRPDVFTAVPLSHRTVIARPEVDVRPGGAVGIDVRSHR